MEPDSCFDWLSTGKNNPVKKRRSKMEDHKNIYFFVFKVLVCMGIICSVVGLGIVNFRGMQAIF
jgi:hypothetical protein